MTDLDVEIMPNRANLNAQKSLKQILVKRFHGNGSLTPSQGHMRRHRLAPEGSDVRRLQIYEMSVYLSKIKVFVFV